MLFGSLQSKREGISKLCQLGGNRFLRGVVHRILQDAQNAIPEESSGKRRFRNILENEMVMNQIFEKFVLRFAMRHCVGAKVRAMKINWIGEWDAEVAKVLPEMRTDVTLNYPHKKVILDCKYYKAALISRHDSYRLHSSHLYQLNAYLQNKSRDAGWEDVSGILLYPSVLPGLHLSFELLGHHIQIESIGLNQPWPMIHEQLLKILV